MTNKSQNVNKYRGDVMTHLEYIKEKVDANYEHLERVNGRSVSYTHLTLPTIYSV